MAFGATGALPPQVLARNVEYRAATQAQRDSLAASRQLDGDPESRFEALRCGAATTIAAALMRGPDGARALLEGLRKPAGRDPARNAILDTATRELASQNHFSPRTVQRLQELLYEVSQADDQPGMTMDEVGRAMERAGVPTRPIAIVHRDPENASSSGSTGAAAATTPTPAGWRERLNAMLEPGEAVPLFMTNQGADMGHIVLAGRNPRGDLFIYDSLQKPCILAHDDPRVDELLARATSTFGGYAARISPSLLPGSTPG